MKFPGWYALVVGLMMFGQWIFFLASGQVPELQTEPARIALHLVAELLTAVILVGAAIRLLRGRHQAVRLVLLGNGMLLYTIIQSPGYFMQRGEWPFVAMFGALLVLTLLSILTLLRGEAPSLLSLPEGEKKVGEGWVRVEPDSRFPTHDSRSLQGRGVRKGVHSGEKRGVRSEK